MQLFPRSKGRLAGCGGAVCFFRKRFLSDYRKAMEDFEVYAVEVSEMKKAGLKTARNGV